MNTTIKIHTDTRKKLRILAALLDKSMVDVMDTLVSEALVEVQQENNSENQKSI